MPHQSRILLIAFPLLALGLYISQVPTFWRSHDEKCYMWLAENLREGNGLTIELPTDADRTFLWGMPDVVSGKNAVTIKYPPGQSLLLAMALELGGPTLAYWVVPGFGVLMAWILWLITFRITKSQTHSWLAATLLLATPTWYIHSRSLLSDIPAAVCIYAAVLFCIKGVDHIKNGFFVAAGLALGVGTLFRYPTLLSALPLAWFVFTSSTPFRKRFLQLVLIGIPCLISVLLVLYLNHRLFGSPWTTGYSAVGEEGFTWNGFMQNLANYAVMSCVLLPGSGLALCWVAGRKASVARPNVLTPLLMIPLLYILFYSLWGNLAQLSYKPQDLLVLGPRLILPAVPALALVLSLALIDGCQRLKLPKATVWLAPLGLIIVSLGVRLVFEQRTRDYAEANSFIQNTTPDAGLVLLKPHWFKIIWPQEKGVVYSPLQDGSLTPSQETLMQQVREKGKRVYVVQDPYKRLGVRDPQDGQTANPIHVHHIQLREQMSSPFEISVYEIESP